MSQTWTAPENSLGAKAIDFAFVIPGWPTIYTVAQARTVPASGSTTPSTSGGFASVTRAWANAPQFTGIATRGRPEGGAASVGEASVTVLDRMKDGNRELLSLCCRHKELLDVSTFPRTAVASGVDADDPEINVWSIAGFPNSGVAFVGQECVAYSVAEHHPTESGLFRLAGCTRGYRMTVATAHDVGAGVYSFMPNIYGRRAIIYKGYQDLAFDQWVPAFAGVVSGIERIGPSITFSLDDTRWLTEGDGLQQLLGVPLRETDPGVFRPARIAEDARISGTEERYDVRVEAGELLANEHYLIRLGENWFGVKGLA